ncbi:MAG TPA: alpha/beta hydrolase family protein [Acidimicrobiales bacterium]|nr:alpha/beta hydrolase family protein [Acidimicrobiales bacterium]
MSRDKRNFSPWYAWMVELDRTTLLDPLPLEDISQLEAVNAWRDRCRKRLTELLGPSPERVGLELETVESVQCDGYKRERIVFDTEDVMSVPAFLLVPDKTKEPGPAVLAAHGHGPGKSLICGLVEGETPGGDYALQLVRRGYVVLAPDLRCFGERADWNPPDHYGCDTNLVHAVMAGKNPLAQNLWDLGRCLDVLESHPLVDPQRIGMVGLSYGGTVTLFLSALDERIAASVVSGYFSSWAESHKMPWNMCGSQVMSGMLGRIEHLDVASLIAPRPLLVETGTEDDLFPVKVAQDQMTSLRAVYDSLGALDCVEHDVFEGGHAWHGERAYPFLEKWLGPPVAKSVL